MKNIFIFLLVGLSICYSAYGASEYSVGNVNNQNYPNVYHTGHGKILKNTNSNSAFSTNPNNEPNSVPTPNHTLGNGGNTGGIGTDNGGGNGPVH